MSVETLISFNQNLTKPSESDMFYPLNGPQISFLFNISPGSWLYYAKEYGLTPHYVTSAALVTGADGEQQPELCQARVDLRHQRPPEDAALSTLHCCPMNFLSAHNHVWC